MAFNEENPIDSNFRGDVQAGIISSTIANIWRGRSKPYSVADFLPKWTPPKPQSSAEIKAFFKQASKAK